MNKGEQERLARYEKRHIELAKQIADIGFIAPGSIVKRFMKCGTPTCRCRADPPLLHGPYYQLTTKVNGKTVTRQLPAREAKLYKSWIVNGRKIDATIKKMRDVAAKAQDLILRDSMNR